MVQVQLRVPDNMVDEIDKLVEAGKFRSRSEAIKAMIAYYNEREKTLKFLKMLTKRTEESRKNPEIMIPLDDIK